MFFSLPRQFQSITHHTVDSAPREDGLLDGHLFVGSLLETPADVSIFSFVVFTDDTEINLTGLPIFQRRLNSLKKPHGPKIDVLPKRSADGNQQPPKRNVIC